MLNCYKNAAKIFVRIYLVKNNLVQFLKSGGEVGCVGVKMF